MRGGGCIAARPGELVTSALSFLVGPGVEKCPKSDPFALLLNILNISFRNITKTYGLHDN
ncbi:hypothetical protein GmHk_20G057734 [Glycine max]|nr:hypothetical protein GmHk_20G057734 [Glycine max]